MKQQLTVRKTLTLPANIVEILEGRASKLGFNFPQFVRYLLANEATAELDSLPKLSQSVMNELEQAETEFSITSQEFTEVDYDSVDDVIAKLEAAQKLINS